MIEIYRTSANTIVIELSTGTRIEMTANQARDIAEWLHESADDADDAEREEKRLRKKLSN